MSGASTAIALLSALTEPMVRPCAPASAADETTLCSDAVTVAPSRPSRITMYIIQPCVTAPNRKYESVEATRPTIASRCGVKRLSSRPSRKPCDSAETTPTANSDQPFCSGPQPNLKSV